MVIICPALSLFPGCLYWFFTSQQTIFQLCRDDSCVLEFVRYKTEDNVSCSRTLRRVSGESRTRNSLRHSADMGTFDIPQLRIRMNCIVLFFRYYHFCEGNLNTKRIGPRGNKMLMLNSTEHVFSTARKN